MYQMPIVYPLPNRVLTRALRWFLLCVAVLCLICTVQAQATVTEGSTLQRVRENDVVRCGVHSTSKPGFSEVVRGDTRGFEADFCRAIAAATLGDARKVDFRYFSVNSRFMSLSLNEMDVLIRSTTWTSERDSNFVFGPIIFYDEQAFLVAEDSPIRQLEDFNNQTICVNQGTTTETSLALLDQIPNIQARILPTPSYDSAQEQYLAGSCQIWSADRSTLVARRSELANPEQHRFLDLGVVFSKEPLAPVMQKGDSQWADIVRWTVYATILAEELNINSTNAKLMRDTGRNAAVKRLLGVQGAGTSLETLGLAPDAFFKVIQQVGNYGEIFERNLDSLGIVRGQNALYTRGGLLYAPPLR